MTRGTANTVSTAADWVVEKYQNLTYGWGSKDARSGALDCSGFTEAIYNDLGVKSGRGTYGQMKKAIDENRFIKGSSGLRGVQPGDLIFINSSGGNSLMPDGKVRSGNQPTHVVMVAGVYNGNIVVWESAGDNRGGSRGVKKNYIPKKWMNEPYILGIGKAPSLVTRALGTLERVGTAVGEAVSEGGKAATDAVRGTVKAIGDMFSGKKTKIPLQPQLDLLGHIEMTVTYMLKKGGL